MTDTSNLFPPAWSLALGQAGRFMVLGSAALFVFSALAWAFFSDTKFGQRAGKWAFTLGCVGLFGVFVDLGILFVNNRFEYEYIYQHADTKNTIPYRIAGIWSGQQGSFLLWGVAAAVFGLLIVRLSQKYRRWFTISYALFLGAICGILAFESPFVLNMIDGQVFVPRDGVGLSPSLQNYWVIIHPPTIFMGFGSLTALFGLAFAAMVERDYDTWIPIVRPWSIISVTLVGLGLCMGGFWAYETLGWGGFWMWDPVENVSFVPWCFAAAFTHGIIVQTTKKKWKLTNLMFGGLPFLTFIYGTFLTRSGFLADASVHSFAEMNRSALKQLVAVMVAMTLSFLVLWFVRYFQARKEVEPAEQAQGYSREGFYKLGNMFLTGLGLATLIGMSVPFFQALQGKKPAVIEEHAYHNVLVWLFVPLMLIMAIAPFISWRGSGISEIGRRGYAILCTVIGVLGSWLLLIGLTRLKDMADLTEPITLPFGWQVRGLGWILFLFGLCLFGMVAAIWRMIEQSKASKLSLAPFVAHIGVAVLMAGLIVSRGFERKEQVFVTESLPAKTNNYLIQYAGQTSDRTDRDNKLRLEVRDIHDPNIVLFVATPGLYYVNRGDGPEQPMMWPHIQHSPFYDVYVALQPPQQEASDPISLAPGEVKVIGSTVIRFLASTREGQPGQPGTKFGARLKFENGGQTATVNPTMELGAGSGPIQHPAQLDPQTSVSIVGMDAATHGITIQLTGSQWVYPVEVFHKPFVGLVWLGAGILAFGGFLSAYYRRRVPVAAEVESTEPKVQPKAKKVRGALPEGA